MWQPVEMLDSSTFSKSAAKPSGITFQSTFQSTFSKSAAKPSGITFQSTFQKVQQNTFEMLKGVKENSE
jgi:hypothetical protein